MSASGDSTPRTCVKNWRCAAFAQARLRTPLATACTPSIFLIASASSGVSVLAEPRPLAMFMLSPPRV